MRLRELLLEQKVAQQEQTVPIGSRTTSDLWQTAAAAVTSDTSVMNGSTFLTIRPSAGQNISQAILNVLQGIRPRHQNQTFQVYISKRIKIESQKVD